MGFINLEIKAICHDPGGIEKLLKNAGADYKGEDHQIDTYFNTETGRLKIREGNIENALIFYHRKNQTGPKVSDVILHKIIPEGHLKQILIAALGVKVIIDKKRKIFFIDNVKFHIDEVKGLGYFVEIEAIDQQGHGDKKRLQDQCEKYIKMLKIAPQDLISDSYSDLLNR